MKTAPTLLVLAAGMGSRYRGLKQLDPVGPAGETILDYAVYDAIRAGFDRVVFVIRTDFEEAFRTQIGAKYAGRIAVAYAFQAINMLPESAEVPADRVKPWGTGHAVWCAREVVGEVPFAVINADDFLGRDAFAQLAAFVAAPDADHAMVGFRLANTLSDQGTVSRGVCQVDEQGFLSEVVEHPGIAQSDVGPDRMFTGEESVSMNCWAFQPSFWPALDRQWRAFVDTRLSEPKAEFYLPAAVSAEIVAGRATVRVRPTTAAWFGVTYREDKPVVEATLRAMVESGEYPARLFGD
ncbi:nucleotidyltransferase family protein [Synoicihabitans lomoniglobus]|uniref:Sugar phosphate nucleotidyltransferase n=1 Tax=Synoicihabitans lomoniglobus TaxID=2909285 RepID=A0AAE9ZTF6_9BACT|nr:NTP transferase domain-containing protein [Opitutaceae bacterium LMO-M01]WED64845.1 sugar phosphate nucleotidyltransferase [Opitutaceae bacterium LMO-M01]